MEIFFLTHKFLYIFIFLGFERSKKPLKRGIFFILRDDADIYEEYE